MEPFWEPFSIQHYRKYCPTKNLQSLTKTVCKIAFAGLQMEPKSMHLLKNVKSADPLVGRARHSWNGGRFPPPYPPPLWAPCQGTPKTFDPFDSNGQASTRLSQTGRRHQIQKSCGAVSQWTLGHFGSLENRDPFCLNGLECSWVLLGALGAPWVLMGCSIINAWAVWLKRVRVLLGASGCSWGAPGCSWGAPGMLLGSSWVFVGAPGAPGTPGVPWVLLVILTSGAALWLDRRYNDPPKQSMLSALTESERVLVCWIRILSWSRTPRNSHALGITIHLE